MAGLVDYSDSESDEDADALTSRKKRRLSLKDDTSELPPLPASFLDQYSSTVRTSTQDDPSLHAGRKRVTPHVEGNWPTHVYLEWHPHHTVAQRLNDFLTTFERPPSPPTSGPRAEKAKIYSLLQNDLGVALPLHISLSRLLVLKTAQKEPFLRRLTEAITDKGIRSFNATPNDLAWHPNESSTRWFLVLRLNASTTPELADLLKTCNDVAREFNQPALYTGDGGQDSIDRFHISLAWSLSLPESVATQELGNAALREMIDRPTDPTVGFAEVKVRIGQDVHSLPLKARRQSNVAH